MCGYVVYVSWSETHGWFSAGHMSNTCTGNGIPWSINHNNVQPQDILRGGQIATQLCNIEQQYDDVRPFWLHKEIVTRITVAVTPCKFHNEDG